MIGPATLYKPPHGGCQGEVTLPTYRPCAGCGEPVSHQRAVLDRDGWWHPECEQAAWEASDCGRRPVVAKYGRARG